MRDDGQKGKLTHSLTHSLTRQSPKQLISPPERNWLGNEHCAAISRQGYRRHFIKIPVLFPPFHPLTSHHHLPFTSSTYTHKHSLYLSTLSLSAISVYRNGQPNDVAPAERWALRVRQTGAAVQGATAHNGVTRHAVHWR